MLEKLIENLIPDMELGNTKLASEVPGTYAIPLDDGLTVLISEIPNGISLKCSVAPYPKVHEEIFSTQAMLGNLFGQGTRGATLGLSNDGNTLTLTQIIDYNIDYKEFKELLEDFINAVDFWRDEALNHK
ncbi:MAG: type III secretion system chaperone [Parachlamydiaceae bacterium]|nr:type III secretion system chaperone [Parachlamydiaceae bacterium]